jgi:hypothetical protein
LCNTHLEHFAILIKTHVRIGTPAEHSDNRFLDSSVGYSNKSLFFSQNFCATFSNIKMENEEKKPFLIGE